MSATPDQLIDHVRALEAEMAADEAELERLRRRIETLRTQVRWLVMGKPDPARPEDPI